MSDAGGMKAVIEKSKGLDAYDRELFTALFAQLSEEQQKLYDDLSSRVERELLAGKERKRREWNTVTALADEEELESLKNCGMYPILSMDVNREHMRLEELKKSGDGNGWYSCGIAFLNCSYSQICEYTEREYTAHVSSKNGEFDVGYRLFLSDLLMEKEEILERTAAQYDIEQPFIFSPMSRRAVVLTADFGAGDVKCSGESEVDFDFSGNKLDRVLLTGKVLVWNVEITGRDDLPYPSENVRKNIVPLFDQTFEIYKFGLRDESEYIYVDHASAEIKRIDHDIYMGVPAHSEIKNLRYFKIRLHRGIGGLSDGAAFVFRNSCRREAGIKTRVRTDADIEYVARMFSPGGITYKRCETRPGDYQSIDVYDSRRRYHYPKSGRLKSSSLCYLVFERGESVFFEDIISYLLSFMNYMYPEFWWVGVV